jgi:hypothetical protein
MNMTSALNTAILRLKLLEVWEVTAGPASGTSISIQIGRKHNLKVPLTNPRLREDQRFFEGEIGLLIECPWRLHSRTAVICSWSDDNSIDGPMVTGLHNSLLGSPIEHVKMSKTTLDLFLSFANGVHLTIFCDSANTDDDNYSVFDRRFIYTVGPRSHVRREPRSEDARPILRVL